MAEQTESKNEAEAEQSNGGDGSNGGHKVVQAAAIAAATGAAALAARKAFSARDQASEGGEKPASRKKSGDDQSTIVAMASSSWAAASHTIMPFAEEAAGAAGDWVGRNAPDVVVETIVPRFIKGFERARSQSDHPEEERNSAGPTPGAFRSTELRLGRSVSL
jgi:hypothetical protein